MTKKLKQFINSPHQLYFLLAFLLCLFVALIAAWHSTSSLNELFSAESTNLDTFNPKASPTLLQEEAQKIVLINFAVSATIIALFSFLVLQLYRNLQQPLHEMKAGAERFAQGEFNEKLPNYQLREINDLARAMDKMGAQLKHLEEIRSDFVANVSHELKTPITSIQGFVETLLDGALENREDLLRFLEIINKQSYRLTQIIDDLLTLARLESGRIEEELILHEESVSTMLGSVIDISKELASEKSILLTLNCSESLVYKFDRSLMEQAVANLVHNAIKYSDEGSKVNLSAKKSGDKLEIRIKDQGPGIAAEHLPRLFERFYRIDKARSRAIGGTGLGLSIVKHIAAIHDGEVTVISEMGKGSEFCMTI